MFSRIKDYVKRVKARFVANLHNKPIETYNITYDDQSLYLECNDIYGDNKKDSIQWSDVNLVWMYKVDMFAFDRISMALAKDQSEAFSIHEQMEGWNSLLEALPNYLPGIDGDWFSRVAFPAFATNQTFIYKSNKCTDELVASWTYQDYEPEPYCCLYDILFISIILITFPWIFLSLSEIMFYWLALLWLPVIANLVAFTLLMMRIFVYWKFNIQREKLRIAAKITTGFALVTYYVLPFLLLKFH